MSGPEEAGDPFAHSMTDLMAGVAVTFLLIAAIFIVRASRDTRTAQEAAHLNEEQARELQALKGENRQVIEALAALARELDPTLTGSPALEDSHIDPNDPFALTLVLKRNKVTFAAGACGLEPAADEALSDLVLGVLPRVCKAIDDQVVQQITLEGHTDNRGYFPGERMCGVEAVGGCNPDSVEPICVARGFENNVRLSGARAQQVFFRLRALIAIAAARPGSAIDTSALTRCLEDHFSIAGRGPVEPLAELPTRDKWRELQDETTRETNRRVVIKLRAMARTKSLVGGTK
jgi:outer membrane protein OmpA-like peptidoglycan-associated protein